MKIWRGKKKGRKEREKESLFFPPILRKSSLIVKEKKKLICQIPSNKMTLILLKMVGRTVMVFLSPALKEYFGKLLLPTALRKELHLP